MNEYFKIRFGKAIDYWGLQSFPVAYLDRAEFKTKDLSQDEMATLCEHLIDTCERAPSIAKVIAAASSLRMRRVKNSRSASIFERCESCDGDGYVNAFKEAHNRKYSFSFRCPDDNCPAAKNNCPPDYTKWSVKFEPEYRRENNEKTNE